jgi:hypothetical protein
MVQICLHLELISRICVHRGRGLNSLGSWVGLQPVFKAGLKSWCPKLVPRAGSRAESRAGSRAESRAGSRAESRAGSRAESRAGSRAGSRAESRAGSRAESEKRLVDGCQNPPTS